MRREKKYKNKYPVFLTQKREVTSVFRDENGYMVYSEISNGEVKYKLTNLKDLTHIKPNETGRRRFNSKRDLSSLQKNVVNENFLGPLFMYCIHEENQRLLPIEEFTFRRADTKHLQINIEFSVQPFCKESKYKYVNSNGNSKRTKQQLFEGSVGSRCRGLITAMTGASNKIDLELIFNKFNNKCFCCDKNLDIKIRSQYEIDHVMPASGYWPLTQESATLLCENCNQKKKNHHPCFFYSKDKIKELSNLVNMTFNNQDFNYILNDDALFEFNRNFDDVINKWLIINRNKDSFSKYLKREIKRLKKLNLYSRHNELIKKLEIYEKEMGNI
jgi:hypothetical protein